MTFSAFDHQCMALALRQAERGRQSTHPNPRVGCVLTRGSRVLAHGFHAQAGKDHAERAALAALEPGQQATTAYITLEPCSFTGRTPPCTDALIAAGIREVVVATVDPNPRVSGSGLEQLRQAGIEVRTGLLKAEAEALNAGFFKRMQQGLPWVRLKMAQSLDGRTALKSGQSQWITGPQARADVQRWRAEAAAILTGIGTVLADNPSLNVRLPGAQRQPLRVVVDSHWRLPATAKMLGLPGPVLVAGLEASAPSAAAFGGQAELLPLPALGGRVDLRALLAELARREINEIHTEAGATLSGALLDNGLVDEILLYQANCLLGHEGAPSLVMNSPASMRERLRLRCLDRRILGDDLRMRLRPQYSTHV